MSLPDNKNDSFENKDKVSKPTEKLLEKQKRNKRKSKVFSVYKIQNEEPMAEPEAETGSDSLQDEKTKEVVIAEISRRKGPLFSDKDFQIDNCNNNKFTYTLEQFDSLSVQDDSRKENRNVNTNSNLDLIVRELYENATPSFNNSHFHSQSELQPQKYGKKSFAERFRNTEYKEAVLPSKRFKI